MKLAAQLEGRQLKRVICGQALLTAYLGGVDREQHSVGVVGGGCHTEHAGGAHPPYYQPSMAITAGSHPPILAGRHK